VGYNRIAGVDGEMCVFVEGAGCGSACPVSYLNVKFPSVSDRRQFVCFASVGAELLPMAQGHSMV
jgi:hypothetical protein